jgi:hypothetical protein
MKVPIRLHDKYCARKPGAQPPLSHFICFAVTAKQSIVPACSDYSNGYFLHQFRHFINLRDWVAEVQSALGSRESTAMMRLYGQVLNVRLERTTTSDEYQNMLNMSSNEIVNRIVHCYVLVLVRPV